MTSRFSFHAGAVEDLSEARDWYEDQRPGLSLEFERAVDAGLERIATSPEAYAEVEPRIRRYVLSRFPYALFYRVSAGVIEVLAVFHHRRDPFVWNRRGAV
jgi:plasmid stabilization system protein ParE